MSEAGEELIASIAGRRCTVCAGTGKLPTYRGPRRSLPCHFCEGRGRLSPPAPEPHP